MNASAQRSFAEVIGLALGDAMQADAKVIMMGQDIGHAGGPFGITRGLQERFGKLRVLDSPIAEATMIAAAYGAALGGYRPIAEIMFMDFATLSMDALVNQAAKAHFMFGEQCAVPLVVRTAHGGGLNAGAQHSQCLEAWFAHVPGLKVVCPANVADAYGLLRAAIDDNNPVVFVEHKRLYTEAEPFARPARDLAIGTAAIVRAGTALTIVAYGAAVRWARRAAETLALENIDVEIVDLRSLQPWDENLVLSSLAKTHRLLIVHEAVEAFGIGAEIAARMADVGFELLHAPIRRLAAPHIPVPMAPTLESDYLPSARSVIEASRRLVAHR